MGYHARTFPPRSRELASFTERMLGAAKLDVQVYEEVEADTGATGQAMGVVLLSSVAGGIGSAGLGAGGLGGVVVGGIAALIGWVAWAFLTSMIDTRLLPEPQTRSDVGELMRTLGFGCDVLGPVTWSGSHRRHRPRRGSPLIRRRHRPRRGSPRLQHRLDLDAGGHGDRRSSSSGLHEHRPGCRGVSCGVGGFDRDWCRFPDLLRLCCYLAITLRQHLAGDGAVQAGVTGFVELAHAPAPSWWDLRKLGETGLPGGPGARYSVGTRRFIRIWPQT